jgi:Domain of unknown function (DUF4442)
MKKSSVIKFLSLWPPYIGAGIRVKNVADNFRSLDVEMNLRFWNKNYVGTQFGGSLYSMVDPFLMLMLIENLGKEYIVWDKAAAIRFKKPGQGRVHAHFEISEEEVRSLRKQADENYKVEPVFNVLVKDDAGEVIAEVDKTIYIRRKDAQKPPTSSEL